MKLLKPETDVQKLVLTHYEALPPQQQLVAKFMLDNLREVAFLSVPDLSQRCGASEATIVRFAQRIGYDGYSGLKAALLEAVREKVLPTSVAASEALARIPEGDPLTAVAQQETANINRSLEDLDRSLVTTVADALFEAEHIYTFGRGVSSYLAGVCAYLLTQVGLRANALYPGYSSPLEPLVMLKPEDVVVVITFPPYSKPTLSVARAAVRQAATVVAIVDRLSAPISTVATHTLPVRTENMMYTNSFASVSALLNGLVTTIALRHPEEVAQAVKAITEILETDDAVA